MLKQMTILLAMLMIGALTVSAQDVYCGDLLEADCQILIDNSARMHELDSFHFEAEMAMEMAARSGDSQDSANLGMTGSGDLAMDSSAADGLDGMAEQAEAVIGSLAGQMRFAIRMEAEGEEQSYEMDMRMRDSVFFLSGTLVDDVLGAQPGDMEWFAFDMTGAIAAMLEMTGISEEALRDAPDQAAVMPGIARLDDADLNGAPVAVFESTIDMFALVTDSAEVVNGTAGMLGIDGTVSSGELTNRHYIGLDDGYTHRQELFGALSVDGLTMDGASGDLDITMNMTIDMSAFNEPVAVELPEDAPAFPLAMLLAMSSQ